MKAVSESLATQASSETQGGSGLGFWGSPNPMIAFRAWTIRCSDY